MSESHQAGISKLDQSGKSFSRRSLLVGLLALPGTALTAKTIYAKSPADLARQLTDVSWPTGAASRVASQQASIQAQIELADPKLAIDRLEKLKSLAKYPVATRLLLRHPHLAGFIMHASDPMRTAEILSEVADSTPAMNSLMMFAAEAEQVIDVIDQHQKSLFRLPRDGEPFDQIPVSLFLGTSSHDQEYKNFVEKILLWSQGDSARRVAVVGSLTRCSDRVRELFRTQPLQARRAARDWMEFCDTHPDHGEWMCGLYFELDALLQYFMVPSARDMAEHAGVQAALLFLESNLRPELAQILPRIVLLSDSSMINAIRHLKDQVGLKELLSRESLSAATVKAALLAAEDNTERLTKWTNMSDAAIARDVGTADIGVWEHVPFVDVAVKIVDGRELTAIDGVLVVVDTASLAFPFVKGGSVGLRSAGSVVRKDVVEAATKAYGRAMATKATKMTIKELQKQLPDVFEAAAKKAMRQQLKQGGLDVTGLTRLAFEQVGRRSKAFKKFTGLDSKVFMRSDRVVVIYPHRTLVGQLLREVIDGETATLALAQSGDSIVEAKEKIEQATGQLGAIWVACNEPNGIGEIISQNRNQ